MNYGWQSNGKSFNTIYNIEANNRRNLENRLAGSTVCQKEGAAVTHVLNRNENQYPSNDVPLSRYLQRMKEYSYIDSWQDQNDRGRPQYHDKGPTALSGNNKDIDSMKQIYGNTTIDDSATNFCSTETSQFSTFEQGTTYESFLTGNPVDNDMTIGDVKPLNFDSTIITEETKHSIDSTFENDITDSWKDPCKNLSLAHRRIPLKNIENHYHLRQPPRDLQQQNEGQPLYIPSEKQPNYVSQNQDILELLQILRNEIPMSTEFISVEKINIQNKQLKSIRFLKDILPNVYECNVSYNHLESLDGIPFLTTTCFGSHNELTSENCILNNLPHLERLIIPYNSFGPDLNFLSGCLHLREVDLSFNNIYSLNGIATSRVPLKILNLSSNKICGHIDFREIIQKGNDIKFQSWLTIEYLDLSRNQIKSVKNISLLPNLRTLNLDDNPIEFIEESNPKSVSNLRNLMVRNTLYKFKGIKLSLNNELPFQRLTALRIDGFPDVSTWSTFPTGLQELEIRNTFTSCLPRWQHLPKSLRVLKLENIEDLTSLPPKLCDYVPYLKELLLPNNKLKSCYNLIEALPTECLTKIDLRHNVIALKHNNQKIYSKAESKEDLPHLIRLTCPNIKVIVLSDNE